MIEKCKRCGHIKTGIAHKVFTSCAKYKHKTYNLTGLLNNYLLKMPMVIDNEEDYQRYLDDINYILLDESSYCSNKPLEYTLVLEILYDNNILNTSK